MATNYQDYRSDSYKKIAEETAIKREEEAAKKKAEQEKTTINIKKENIISSKVKGVKQVAIKGKPSDNIEYKEIQEPNQTKTEPNNQITPGINDPVTILLKGQPIMVSGGVAGKLSQQSIRSDATAAVYYGGRTKISTQPPIEKKEPPKGVLTIAREPTTAREKISRLAGEIEFKQQRREQNVLSGELMQAGLGITQSFIYPITQPVSYIKDVGRGIYSVFTSPMSTGAQIGQELIQRPGFTAGSITGDVVVGKGVGKIVSGVVKVEVVKDLNLPSGSTSSLEKTGNLAGGTSTYKFTESLNTQKGMVSGIKISYPTITGKGSRVTSYSLSGNVAKGEVFIPSPKYTSFLEKNPLYRQLLETEIEISPTKTEYTYKTEIVKENGRTIIRDVKVPVDKDLQTREIEISSGGGLVDKSDSDKGLKFTDRFTGEVEGINSGGGGGGVGVQSESASLNRLVGPSRQKSSLVVVEEVTPVILKPFQRTRATTLNYVKTPVYSTSFKNFESSRFLQNNYSGSRSGSVLNQGSSLSLKSVPVTSSATSSTVNTIQNTLSSSKQSQASVQAQKQAQSQVQSQVSVQNQMLSSVNLLKTQNIKLPKIDVDVGEQRGGLFSVEVRRGGSFKTIGRGLNLQKAIGLGRSRVEGTAAATFRITKQGRPYESLSGINGKYYTKPGGLFIEKNEFRIKSPGELSEITYAGIRSQRKRGGF